MNAIESIAIDDNFFQLIKTESGKAIVFVNTPKFTLIPSEYYCKEMRSQYFDFIHFNSSDEIIIENKLPDWSYYILFSVKKNFKLSVEKHYSQAEFYHYASALVSWISEADSQTSPAILINKRNENLYLLISKSNEIVLLNLFHIKSDADIIYFILNGLRENNINPESASIYYSGDIKHDDHSIQNIRKYLGKTVALTLPPADGNKTSLFEYFRFNPTE